MASSWKWIGSILAATLIVLTLAFDGFTDTHGHGESSTAMPTLSCNEEKIDFEQEVGCFNDGSVEFCVPVDDVWLRLLLAWFVPAAYDVGHGGGQARCDAQVETLYFYPTPSDDPKICIDDGMTDRAWRDMCRISFFPQIRRIVATWYE